LSGSEFQTVGAATEKAWLAKTVRVRGTPASVREGTCGTSSDWKYAGTEGTLDTDHSRQWTIVTAGHSLREAVCNRRRRVWVASGHGWVPWTQWSHWCWMPKRWWTCCRCCWWHRITCPDTHTHVQLLTLQVVNRWQWSASFCWFMHLQLSTTVHVTSAPSCSNSLLVYEEIHGLAKFYLNELFIPNSTVPNLSTLNLLLVALCLYPEQGYNSTAGHLCGWSSRLDSLPLDIRSAPTLATFRNMLKTHFFSRSFFND